MENLEITPKPNWLELPRDTTMNILQRLCTLEIVTSASVVCPLWWNICKDPLMWRTIDMITGITLSYSDDLDTDSSYFSRLRKICCYAVDRSCGHLQDIYIKNFGTDELLLLIANSAKIQLRCIRLEGCYDISNEAFKEIVKKQPFLEELDIHWTDLSKDLFEYIGRSCPLLESLKFSPPIEVVIDFKCDDVAFAIGKTMPKLKHLTILNNELTNNGLLAILDGCPLLESLDIRGCIYVDLNGGMRKRCNAQLKVLRFPAEYVDYKFDSNDYAQYMADSFVKGIRAKEKKEGEEELVRIVSIFLSLHFLHYYSRILTPKRNRVVERLLLFLVMYLS